MSEEHILSELPEGTRKYLGSILNKKIDQLTADEKKFLRARRDYLNEVEEKRFAAILDADVAEDAEPVAGGEAEGAEQQYNEAGWPIDGEGMVELEKCTNAQLKDIATELKIELPNRANKTQMIELIQAADDADDEVDGEEADADVAEDAEPVAGGEAEGAE